MEVSGFVPEDATTPVGAKDVKTGAPVTAEMLSQKDSKRFNNPSSSKKAQEKDLPLENKDNQKGRGEKKDPKNNSAPEIGGVIKNDNKKKDEDKKPEGSTSKEKEDFSGMDFSDLNSLRKNFTISETRRQQAEAEFNRRVEAFQDLREGEVVNLVRHEYLTLVRNTNWDGIYSGISQLADKLEDVFERRLGKSHPELMGVITEVLNVERAQLLLEGMRRRGVDRRQNTWLKKHGYTQQNYDRFQELVRPVNSVLDIERTEVEDLAEMVGQDIKKQQAQIQRNLTPDQMAEAVKKGTSEALNVPSVEAERRAFRDREYMMGAVPPVDSTTKFLLEANDREIITWNARAQLSRACAIKMSGGMNEIANNQEAKSLTNEQEQILLSMPGVVEAISLEAHVIVNEANLDAVLKNNGEPLPETIFDISEVNALDRFRRAKIEWLMTYKGLTEDQAKDAEAVSRNFIFLNDLVEDFDSIYDKEDKPTREDHQYIPNSMPRLKSVAVWQTMHLQERLVAKNKGDSNWSAFGPYANSHPKNIDGLLPPNLFKSALEIGKDRNTVNAKGEGGRTLLEVFVENGARLAIDPRSGVVTPAISHPNAREGRMSGYCAVTLSAAATVLNALSKPSEIVQTKNWGPLGDALRDLEVYTWYKQKISIAILGVKTSKLAIGFEPLMGWGKYGEYVNNEIKRSDPRFFDRPKRQGVFDGVSELLGLRKN